MSQEAISTADSAFIRSELDAIPGMTPRARETLETLPFDRDTITTMVNNLIEDTNTLEGEPYVTWDAASALLTGARLIVDGDNVTFSTTATEIAADLTDTGVVAGAYGDASHVIAITVGAKGRALHVEAFALNSDNVTEGAAHLFFTTARARGAISAGAGINYDPTTGVISLADSGVTAGTYAPPTSETVDRYGRVTSIT